MSKSFWFQHPNELIKDFEFWPREKMTFEQKLNAISRLVIFLSTLGYIYTRNIQILVVGLITLGAIIFLYQQKHDLAKQEGFSMQNEPNESEKIFKTHSPNNPLGNVMLTEIHDNPNRGVAPPAFAPPVAKNINSDVQQMVQDNHPDFPNMKEKLFKDLGDSVDFHNSMIPFNSNPSTQIPNDQDAFAKFCYGDMPSCKAGDDVACSQNTGSYLP